MTQQTLDSITGAESTEDNQQSTNTDSETHASSGRQVCWPHGIHPDARSEIAAVLDNLTTYPVTTTQRDDNVSIHRSPDQPEELPGFTDDGPHLTISITLHTKQNLTEKAWKIQRSTVVRNKVDGLTSPTSRYGTSGHTDTLYDGILLAANISRTILSIWSHPYSDDFRDIPLDRMKVYLPDPVCEIVSINTAKQRDLSKEQVQDCLTAAINLPDNLNKHTPTEEYKVLHESLTVADTYRDLGVRTQSPLKERLQAVNQTLRSLCGFSQRYGPSVPEPHVEFAHVTDLNQLQEEQQELEDKLDRHQLAYDHISSRLSSHRAQKQESAANTHLPKPLNRELF